MAILVKCALNGGTSRSTHPAVPCSPAELAAEARAAVDAGAGALHLHARDASGDETLDADAVDAAVGAVRQACPDVPVGVTTGIWTVGGDAAARADAVRAWRSRPDFASVNFGEPAPEELSELLLERGMGVEAGLWRPEDAERLAASGLASRCVRVLIEPQPREGEAALATARAIRERLAEGGVTATLAGHRVPLLQHGYGEAAWDVLRAAVAEGLDVRTGLEDVNVLPDGRRAAGNADLVGAAMLIARSPGAP